ncbi:gamma-glutamyl-gamma-aminobutyrate hydrolase family protein [Candidatus Woesearchaeota archaeon]|nr:gamma-glutamyl-gamma-aminobutyrate hydrolase family protein [Candidatus Woesearchaeota archaeon]
MILVISVCKEKLHELEFVKPIIDIVKNCKIVHYSNLKKSDLENAEKVIICGTSLKDNEFLKHLDKFSWLKTFDKPVLGICAGMQIIGLVFGGKLMKKKEIGYFKENLKGFFGLNEVEVYHLHGNYVEFTKEFKVYNKGIPQAISYGNIYGVLFHPEVRQKDLIKNFIKN